MKKRVLGILLAVSMAFSLMACGNNGSSEKPEDKKEEGAGKSEKEKVFVVSLGGTPVSYNPDASLDDFTTQLSQSLFSGLLAMNNNEEVIPDLAEKWEISDDNLTYTFHLRKGVKWHDGESFSAEDVKFTYEKIMEEKGFMAEALANVSEITCDDENTVKIVLKEPNAAFLSSLAWYGSSILPKHLYGSEESWTENEAATTNPIGTGPFKFIEADNGVSITLAKNEDYYMGEPEIDKVVYVINTDVDAAYQAFLNGEVDYLTNVPAANVKELQDNQEYSVGCLTAGRRYQMCFNIKKEETANLAVRKAIAKGINREEISQKATNGLQPVAYGFYPPFLEWAYNDKADIGEPNKEEAVKLLEEAGLKKDKDGYYLHFNLLVFNYGNYADCAKVIKTQLQDVGIDIKIEALEEGAWQEKVFGGDYDLCMLAGFQGPDPDNMTSRVGTNGGLNVSAYSNPKVDKLLGEARVITNEQERGELYKEVQAILAEDLPLVPLVEYAGYYASPASITGLPFIETSINDIAPFNFAKVKID